MRLTVTGSRVSLGDKAGAGGGGVYGSGCEGVSVLRPPGTGDGVERATSGT
jgi:hypothetical protein